MILPGAEAVFMDESGWRSFLWEIEYGQYG
jgi:hypothetical protein